MSPSHSNAMVPAHLFPTTSPPEYTQGGITPGQAVTIAWAHRRITLVIAAVILALGFIGVSLWPRTYEATATLMVDFQVNDPLSEHEFPVGLLGSYMATQLDLARGNEVLHSAIDALKLTKDEDFTEGWNGEGGQESLKDFIALKLAKNLTVEQGRLGSQLIHVTYADTKAQRAAQIANAIAEAYSEQQRERTTGPANQRAKRYNEQLDELKDKVNRAQEQFTQFRRKSGLIDSESHYDVDVLLLSNLETRLAEAQTARRAAEARLAGNQSVEKEVLTSNTVQGLKSQLAQHHARLAELSATLGPKHPQVVEIKAQIAAIQRSLGGELGAYRGNAEGELASARKLEASLTDAVAAQRAKVLAVRQQQDEGAKYQLELASAQAVYKKALDGHDQVMFASTGGYHNVAFVSRATPPPKPNKSKTMVVLALCALMAGALGLAVPFAYELVNRRVRCRDDVERDLGMPVLIELGRSDGRELALAGGAA